MKLLEVIAAEYIEEYKVLLKFNEGFEAVVDLKDTIFNDKRKIFFALRDKNYFKDFSTMLNTICWKNGANFAPEFLRSLQPVQESITIR